MADIRANIHVGADVSEAKRALSELQTQLNKITNPVNLNKLNMTEELTKAAQAAQTLQVQLQNATNVNTGRLDLTKFTQQLSQSGMSLEKYQQYFKQFGADGQKAFANLATSIAQAEIPLKNMNSMTQKMWTSIKNTINWQISSSLIHGLVGSFSKMINYAKDLDKSLNNIQIVTGASADKMTQFAKQANLAAKQLNTTTTAYTNASLIYYQQGLNDKQVAERTAVTVKMANVTKESVTDVSSELTAIWNNFAQGSSNLEHFADVITALGAATASSSKEIANGLSKFASVADTVGLSYEKATAALATIVAKTRQSSDTVGTGLRTIFSRLQSVSLGQTLDDGVTLTKYTKALKNVGVEAVDSLGRLRDMDDILMDLGEKWQTLSKGQQVALAQTVGGVRQYTNLIALMDDFENFKSNIAIAETSNGTLQKQADIYAESWEAASKRVKVSAEGIYDRLIDSHDMSNLMDTFAGFLEIIQGIIDGLGGLKGVLVTLGAIATTVFSRQISTGLENMGTSLLTMTSIGRNRLKNFQEEAVNRAMANVPNMNVKNAAVIRNYKNQQLDNLAYLTYGPNLNEVQQAQARSAMAMNRGLYAEAEKAGAAAYEANINYQANRRSFDEARYKQQKQEYDTQVKEAEQNFLKRTKLIGDTRDTEYSKIKDNPAQLANFLRQNQFLNAIEPKYSPRGAGQIANENLQVIGYGRGLKLADIMAKSSTSRADAMAEWENMRAGIKERVGVDKDGNIKYNEFFEGLGNLKEAAIAAAQALDDLKKKHDENPNSEETRKQGEEVANQEETFSQRLDEETEEQTKNNPDVKPVIEKDHEATKTAGTAALARDAFIQSLQEPKTLSGGQALTKIASAATGAASAVMMLSNAFSVLNDQSATGSQKIGAIVSIIMGLGTAIPAVIGLVESLGNQVVIAGTKMSLAMWQVTLIVAAITAVTATIAYISRITDNDEKKLNRLQESSKILDDSYKKAVERTKALKDAFDEYDSVYSTLDNCIKYSDEWYDALENIRTKVLDILKEFPELSSFGENILQWNEELQGYELNPEVRQAAIKEAEKAEIIAKAASIQGQQAVDELALQIQQKNTRESIQELFNDVMFKAGYAANNNLSRRAFEVGIENWLSNLSADDLRQLQASGTFKDAMIASIQNDSNIQTMLAEQAAQNNTTSDKLFNVFSVTLDKFATSLLSNDNLFDELINNAAKQEQIENSAFAQNRALVSSYLAGQGYDSTTIDMVARGYDDKVAELEKIYLSSFKKHRRGGGSLGYTGDNWEKMVKDNDETTQNVVEAIRLYLKQNQDLFESVDSDDVLEGAKNNKYVRFEKVGGGIEKIRIETVAATAAAQKALEALGTSASDATNQLKTLDTNINTIFGNKDQDGTISAGMKTFITTHNFGEDMTQAALAAMSEQMSNENGLQANLEKLFGLEGQTDEQKNNFAASLGFEDFNQLVNQYTNAIDKATRANTTAIETAKAFGNGEAFTGSELSSLSTKNISDINTLYRNVTQSGNQVAIQTLTQLFAGKDANGILNILNAFQETDWHSVTAVEDFVNALKDIDPNIDANAFANSMVEIQRAADGIDVTGFATAMGIVQELLNGGAGAGTTISKDKVKELKEKGYDLSKLGYEDLLGNFILTADKDTVRTELNAQTLNMGKTNIGTAYQHQQQVTNTSLIPENEFGQYKNLNSIWTKARMLGVSENTISKWQEMAQNDADAEGQDYNEEAAIRLFLNILNAEVTSINQAKHTEAEAQYKNVVRQALENAPTLESLDTLLKTPSENGVGTYEDILFEGLENVEKNSRKAALRERAVLNNAQQYGLDLADIKKRGEEYFNDTTGLYAKDIAFESLADAENNILQGEIALQEAEKLRIDSDRIQKRADEIFNQETFTGTKADAIREAVNAEKELIAFRPELEQQAALANINYDEVIEYAKAIRAEDDALKSLGLSEADLIRESEEYALAQLKLKKSLNELKTATSTYHKELKKWASDEKADMDKVHQGLFKYQTILKDIFGGKAEDYTSDFIKNNLDLIEKAASGDEKAFRELGEARAEAIIEGMSDIEPDQRKNLIDTLKDLIAQDDVKVGVTLDFDQAKGNAFLSTLQSWVDNNQIDTSQMLDLAKAGGWEPVTKTVTVEDTVDDGMIQNGTVYTVGADGTVTPVKLDGKSHIQGDGASSYDVIVGWKKTGPGSGGGGGGGGGGKKAHKPKRYRNIENQVQNNNRKLESTTRKKDRSFGTAKLDALKEERKLREENLKLQQQYQSEIEDWLGKDKTSMMDAFAKIGFKPIFDEFGEVINNDEFEKLWEEAGEGAGEEWQEAADALDQYEETLDKYNDKLEEIKEIQEEIFDSFLEETQLEVEMKINVNTANIEYIDYLLGKIEDDAYQAAEAIALLGHKTGEIEIQASVYRKGINDILSHHTLADGTQLSLENIGSMTTDQLLAAGFTDAEIQELQKYRSELLQLNQQLLEMRDTVADKVVDALEKMNEEIQKSYENFDHYNSVLEHYKNINDLINIGNTKMSKEIAGKLNRAMLSNAQNQVKSAREIYDAAKLNMQNAQAEYEHALAVGDEQTAKYWKKIMDAASDQLKESENQWLEAWEGALEQAKAIFETAIQDIVDTYNEQMGSTFGSLDYLQAAYDRQKETNEQYLQDYDRLYELSKLSRDISKSIDDTDSIKGKQKLRDIQAEINKLQADGTKLSQYDIEALQKKYELEKARLALEDVQNAKQTVRLQRDSEGNWGYVYTADEDKVAEAEQEYEDKLHEYQKLNDEYIQELQDKALSAQATYRDLIQEIMSDTTLSDEQRQARLEEVQNWYNEQINFFGQQLTNALNNQEGTLDRYYQRYNDERAKLVDSWKETTLSLLTGTGSMDDYMAHMRESASQMVETAYQALLQYKQDIDQTGAMAGQDSSFSEMVSGVVSGIGELSTATEASISTLADTMTDEFATALQAAVSWESQYVSGMMQMIAQTEAEVTAVNNLIAALSGLDTTALYAAANATVGAAGTGQASTSAANAAEQAAKATAAYSTNPYYASGEKKMTEDFLHIVNDNMVDCNVQLDDIIHMLELQVNAFSEGLGALISAPGIANEPQDILEQNIHIDVSFPNVTQHSEIEKAFENLVNKAAQYANRKN